MKTNSCPFLPLPKDICESAFSSLEWKDFHIIFDNLWRKGLGRVALQSGFLNFVVSGSLCALKIVEGPQDFCSYGLYLLIVIAFKVKVK
jgi:hypothetical protein